MGALLAGAVVLGPALPAWGYTHYIYDTFIKDGAPANPHVDDITWYREQTNAGGTATITDEFGGPTGFGDHALKLTTNSDTGAHAQLVNYDDVHGMPLSAVTTLRYWTYQSSSTGSATDNAAYIFRIDLDGNFATTGDVTTLVYEPYLNDTEGPDPQQPVAPATWQFWDATNGAWWSTNKITCGTFEVEAGSGAGPFTSPGEVADNCPNGKGIAIGANVGPSRPNHVVAVDGFDFLTTVDDYTWDFAPK